MRHLFDHLNFKFKILLLQDRVILSFPIKLSLNNVHSNLIIYYLTI